MRIAEVTATFPPYRGGTGNVAYHHARMLTDLSHDVTVFTPSMNQRPDMPFNMSYLYPRVRFGNASLVLSLARQLTGFDLIHLHYPFIGAESVLVASTRGHIPLLVSYHNRLEESHFAKNLLFRGYNATFERIILKRASIIASVNHDHFHQLFPRLKHVEVPNGVDTNLFRPGDRIKARQEIGVDPADQMALFVGALDHAHRFKNVPILLEAIAPLNRVRLLVIGDGDLKPSLMAYAQQLGISGRVHFLGSMAPDELPTYYRAADVTVLPSNQTESFGLVLVESMACGTPVIASSLPGLRTVVENDFTGLLVPPNDQAALRIGLKRIFSDTPGRLWMGCEARKHVVAHFAWNAVRQRLEDVCVAAAGMRSPLTQNGGVAR